MRPIRVKRSAWVAGAISGLAVVAVGVMFLRSGLDASDKWASVLGVFLNVAGVMIAGYSAILARRPLTSGPSVTPASAPESHVDMVSNRVNADTVRGSVIQGRDIHSLSINHQPTMPPLDRHGGDDSPRSLL